MDRDKANELSKETTMADAIKYCAKGFEACRMRASILPAVSFVFLVAGAWSIFDISASSADLGEWLMGKELSGTDHGKILARNFYWFVYLPLVIFAILHLIRIYISSLIIDEDPTFFHQNLRGLNTTERLIEYVLRIAVFVAVYLAGNDKLLTTYLDATTHSSARMFFSLTIVYATLLFWDIFMMFFTRNKQSSLKAVTSEGIRPAINRWGSSIWRFFANDCVGLTICVFVSAIYVNKVSIDSIMWITVVLTLFVVIYVCFLVVDLWLNGRHYVYHVGISRYIGLKCNDASPFGDCPVQTGEG